LQDAALALARPHWEEIDAQDPGKALRTKYFKLQMRILPWAPPNGSRLQAMRTRVGSASSAKRFCEDAEELQNRK